MDFFHIKMVGKNAVGMRCMFVVCRKEKPEVEIGRIVATTPTDLAGEAVLCEVHRALGQLIWDPVANWTEKHVKVLPESELSGLVKELCQVEVPVVVLKDWSILQAKVSHLGDSLGSYESTFVMTVKRNSQHATDREFYMVKMACGQLVGDRTWMAHVMQAQQAYFSVVRHYFEEQQVDDDSLKPNRSCIDYHPQCELWAEQVRGQVVGV